MIWHVRASDFVTYLLGQGFVLVGKIDLYDVYERGTERIFVRQSAALTQAEVDAICDAHGLNPGQLQTWFGD